MSNGQYVFYGKLKAWNPWIIFCKVHRLEYIEKFPDVSTQDITKMLAAKWKSLTPEEKQPYLEIHEKKTEKVKKQNEKIIRNSYKSPYYSNKTYDLVKKILDTPSSNNLDKDKHDQ